LVTVVLLTRLYPLFPGTIQDFSAGKNQRAATPSVQAAAQTPTPQPRLLPIQNFQTIFPNIDATTFPAQTGAQRNVMPSDPPIPAAPDPRPPAGVPPPLLAESIHRPSSGRQLLAALLSVSLILFLVDAAISFADASLTLFCHWHFLSGIALIIGFFNIVSTGLIYLLMGITPMVPKRWFLPPTLFCLAALLAFFPLALYSIYYPGRLEWICWCITVIQVIFGLVLLYLLLGGFKFRWPLLAVNQLNLRRFSWLNLFGFVLANIFVLLPAAIIFLFFSAAVAVERFSDGFVTLRPDGLTVQVRKYVREDGKTIELFPMAHVADAGFYRQVSQTFPTNSLILMEGVSDTGNLLTNKINYKRMAQSLGLAEQHEAFTPGRGKMVRADVDLGVCSKETIGFLNLVMLVHARGLNPAVLEQLTRYSPPPNFEEQLFADLLGKRNQHLLEEIQARLPESDNLMIPWGAAHMPGIARGILKNGFHLDQTQEYMVIRFRGVDNPGKENRH